MASHTLWTSVTKDYLSHWTLRQALDEFLQNWKDECEAEARRRGQPDSLSFVRLDCSTYMWVASAGAACWTGAVLVTQYCFSPGDASFSYCVHLVNRGARIRTQNFYHGASGSEKQLLGDARKTRGKFGDGLPSASLVLCRQNPASGVKIWTQSEREALLEFSFSFQPDPEGYDSAAVQQLFTISTKALLSECQSSTADLCQIYSFLANMSCSLVEISSRRPQVALASVRGLNPRQLWLLPGSIF